MKRGKYLILNLDEYQAKKTKQKNKQTEEAKSSCKQMSVDVDVVCGSSLTQLQNDTFTY